MKKLLTSSKISARAVFKVLSIPRYFFITLLSGFVLLGLLIWLFSFQTLFYVLSVPFLSVNQKLSYFFSGYTNSFLYFFRDPIVFTRDIFVILAAINISLFIFVRRSSQNSEQKMRGGTSGLMVGLVASGCIACGTSIIAPLLASVGATASASASQSIGAVGNIIGIILTLYSVHGFGKRTAYELARK